jgi:hypothetical protein
MAAQTLDLFSKGAEKLLSMLERLEPEAKAQQISRFMSRFKEWLYTVPTEEPIFKMLDEWVQQGLLTAAESQALTSPWVAAELERFAPSLPSLHTSSLAPAPDSGSVGERWLQ